MLIRPGVGLVYRPTGIVAPGTPCAQECCGGAVGCCDWGYFADDCGTGDLVCCECGRVYDATVRITGSIRVFTQNIGEPSVESYFGVFVEASQRIGCDDDGVRTYTPTTLVYTRIWERRIDGSITLDGSHNIPQEGLLSLIGVAFPGCPPTTQNADILAFTTVQGGPVSGLEVPDVIASNPLILRSVFPGSGCAGSTVDSGVALNWERTQSCSSATVRYVATSASSTPDQTFQRRDEIEASISIATVEPCEDGLGCPDPLTIAGLP